MSPRDSSNDTAAESEDRSIQVAQAAEHNQLIAATVVVALNGKQNVHADSDKSTQARALPKVISGNLHACFDAIEITVSVGLRFARNAEPNANRIG